MSDETVFSFFNKYAAATSETEEHEQYKKHLNNTLLEVLLQDQYYLSW